jgi:acetyl-CoA carboxylase carboxyltransferase component
MFLTGPNVIKEVLNEDVTFEELGGATVHNTTSGVAHFIAENEDECLMMIRTLLNFLPQNNLEDPPILPTDDDPFRREPILDSIIPDDPAKAYDMKEIITAVVDNGEFLEVQPMWAMNMVVGFASLAGRPVGIVANQPKFLAGCIDINSADKATRFVRFCNAFNIPLVTFVDVPGFLPGKGQELGREIALGVFGGDGSETDGYHSEGVRRRVLRDVEPRARERFQRRMAIGGNRGNGRERRGQYPLPKRA